MAPRSLIRGRILAVALDILIVSVGAYSVSGAVLYLSWRFPVIFGEGNAIDSFFYFPIPYLLYFILIPFLLKGQTIGKRIMSVPAPVFSGSYVLLRKILRAWFLLELCAILYGFSASLFMQNLASTHYTVLSWWAPFVAACFPPLWYALSLMISQGTLAPHDVMAGSAVGSFDGRSQARTFTHSFFIALICCVVAGPFFQVFSDSWRRYLEVTGDSTSESFLLSTSITAFQPVQVHFRGADGNGFYWGAMANSEVVADKFPVFPAGTPFFVAEVVVNDPLRLSNDDSKRLLALEVAHHYEDVLKYDVMNILLVRQLNRMGLATSVSYSYWAAYDKQSKQVLALKDARPKPNTATLITMSHPFSFLMDGYEFLAAFWGFDT